MVDLQRLRQTLQAEEAAAVVEQTLLRRKGTAKFAPAASMLFERGALEQATHSQVAQHRAQRFQGATRIADLGCGIGGDSLSLATVAKSVIGFDRNKVRLIFATHNAQAYNLTDRLSFAMADVCQLPSRLKGFDAFFADPARRTSQGKRIRNPHQYHPALDKLMETYYGQQSGGIKVAPGFNFSTVPQHVEVEVISLYGEVKEAVLWFNDFATLGVSRRATLLPNKETINDQHIDTCKQGPLGDYLYEPDAAIIRSGLVQQVAAQLDLVQVDSHIAYLSSQVPISSPFVTGYAIEAQLPLKMKQINRYLKNQHIQRVNVKQRGTGLILDQVTKQLKPCRSGSECTLILTRIQNEHLALICRRLP